MSKLTVIANEEATAIHERLSAPGQTCPECGELSVAGERTRRAVFLKGGHAVYSICSMCHGAMEAGANLPIIEEFNVVVQHLVSAEAYKIVAADVVRVVQ